MPETERKLVLHSPASSEYVEYRWPLARTETWDEAVEIVETIRWVCRDFTDLRLAVEKFILNSFDPTSYESMKQLCERFNRAVANIKKLWSGRQPPPGIDAPPSIPLLRHIINQAYNRAVTSPEELNSYEPFSPEVYGETSFELVCEVMKLTKMTENDTFVDLGSGIGQVVLQVAAKVGCKCYGVEKADIPAKYAECMESEFVKWMDWYGKSYGDFELIKGDFLEPSFDEILNSATVVFTNNFAFGPKLNHEMKLKFSNLKDGTKIVSSHEFCPLNFKLTSRNLSDIGSIMHVAELSPLKGSVSWTGKQVSYYLHTIDRGKLERFFLRQKHPEQYKSESSTRSSSSSSEDEDRGMDTSSESDDHFKSALQRIQLSHTRQERKKNQRDYHRMNSGHTSRTNKGSKGGGSSDPGTGEERWRKKRWRKVPPQMRTGKESLSLSALSSPRITDVNGLFSSFHHQLEAYMGQLNTPYFQQWIVDAIEKEKLKKSHLQGVITHLESEVAGLSKETVEQMKASMKQLGIEKMTPDGLLLGATSIVSQNKQLRKEMNDLERQISSLRHQNKAMEAMCVRQKTDPKFLPQLPPEDSLTNGMAFSGHMTLLGEEESIIDTTPSPLAEFSMEELRSAVPAAVQGEVALSSLDQKHLCTDIVKKYEIELERIDQQLLELGPYAQDAYDDEEPQPASAPVIVSPPPPPPPPAKGRKGKQSTNQKANKRGSRSVDEESVQRGGWRTVGGWNEVTEVKDDSPKKKWRKVGSAGPAMRGRDGQLDAQSDPLNVSSANLILTPTAELERRVMYQTPGGRRGSADPISSHQMPVQVPNRPVAKPTSLPMGPPSVSVSTTALSTPSCNTSSPSDLPGLSRSHPSAQWRAISTTPGVTPTNHDHAQTEPVEEIDVTRIDSDTMPTLPHPPTEGQHLHHPMQGRRGSHSSQRSSNDPTGPEYQSTPSPQTHRPPDAIHHNSLPPHHHSSVPKHPGFSISNLAKGSDTPPHQSHDSHVMPTYIDHRGSVPSPRGDGMGRKRRSSSSSSYRSVRHPFDDNSLARSGSPHAHGQFIILDGAAGMNSPGGKEKMTPATEPGKLAGLPPFAMWPPGMPVPTDPAQLQRLSFSSSPFLAAASNPWLRGGVIPGLPYRPALYPTGAATTTPLDPTNPYKSMLGLSLYPSFPGLKTPFPTPAFTAPGSSTPSSQPQTPSSINPGLAFGQYTIPPPAASGSLLEGQNGRFPGSLVPQPTPFPVGMETNKQRGSPDSGNPEAPPQGWQMIPGVPMLQTQLGFSLPSSLAGAPGLGLIAPGQRGPFSTSPLTLATQSAIFTGGVSSGGDITANDVFHQQGGRRGKKQATIDLTRDPVNRHIEAPSPQEAVKMATAQRMSPFHDPSRFSPKLKGVPDPPPAPTPSSSSPLVPNFLANASTLPSHHPASGLSYPLMNAAGVPGNPALSQVNPKLMSMALSPSSPLVPMNYPGGVVQGVVGKPDEGVSKKRSQKQGRSSGSNTSNGGVSTTTQKLRIHQMEFKAQGKIDRRRKRPVKQTTEKPDEQVVMKSSNGAQSRVSPPIAGSDHQLGTTQEDNYALNMLADCSSKEGEKVTSPSSPATTGESTSYSAKQAELISKRSLTRSPGSIAGANSLLLLATPDQAPPEKTRESTSPETAVVDGLLQLSNATISNPIPEQSQTSSSEQNHNMKKHEPVIRIPTQNIDILQDGTMRGGENVVSKKKKKNKIPHALVTATDEAREGDEVDSEKTDTDSEATLSPTTPGPSGPSSTNRGGRTPQNSHSPTPLLFPSGPTPDSISHSDHVHQQSLESSTFESFQHAVTNETGPKETSNPPLPSPLQLQANIAATETLDSAIPNKGGHDMLSLQPQPPPPASVSRAQVVEEEEEDADVDVENIDSSLLGEPDAKPDLNSLTPQHQIPESLSAAENPVMLPSNVTSSSPVPPPLGDSVDSLSSSPPLPTNAETMYNQERDEEVGVSGGVVTTNILLSPSQPERDEEEEALVHTPSPAKRLRLTEESVEEKMDGGSMMMADETEEQMNVEITSPPPLDTPPLSFTPPTLSSPLPHNTTIDVSPPEPQTNHLTALQDETESSPSFELKVKPNEDEILSLNSSVEESLQSPESMVLDKEKVEDVRMEPDSLNGRDVINFTTSNGIISDISTTTTTTTAVESSEAERGREKEGSSGVSSPVVAPSITWPSETEREEDGELRTTTELSRMPTPPAPPPPPPPPDSRTPSPTDHSKPFSPKEIIDSSHQGDSMTTGPLTKRAISPIQAPDTKDQKALFPSSEENRSQASKDNSNNKQLSPHPVPTNSTTPDNGRRMSPPTVVAQNRLPVGKSGFDRHQQSRKLQHSHKHSAARDERISGVSSGTKKWSRMPEIGSRGRGLFEVDPQEGVRRPKLENRTSERDQTKHTSEMRKIKQRPPSSHTHQNKPITGERSKYVNSGKTHGEDMRHPRPPIDPHSSWDQKDSSSGKLKSRPIAPDHVKEREGVSDEEQRGRMKSYPNSHVGWREERQSPADYPRERSHTPNKHKLHRSTDPSKVTSSLEHGRKISRMEKESRKHIDGGGGGDERGLPPTSGLKRHRIVGGGGGGGGGDEDLDHAPSSRMMKHGSSGRKRSYESVSEDDLLEDSRCSSRESSLVAEDWNRGDRRPVSESGGGGGGDHRWKKETTKRSVEVGGEEGEEFTRTKHKKHKHDSKERKERRKWRKLAESAGGEVKIKRSSEEKQWLSYHKH